MGETGEGSAERIDYVGAELLPWYSILEGLDACAQLLKLALDW